MEELRENNLSENTAVFLVNDNGGSLVTHARNTLLRGGK